MFNFQPQDFPNYSCQIPVFFGAYIWSKARFRKSCLLMGGGGPLMGGGSPLILQHLSESASDRFHLAHIFTLTAFSLNTTSQRIFGTILVSLHALPALSWLKTQIVCVAPKWLQVPACLHLSPGTACCPPAPGLKPATCALLSHDPTPKNVWIILLNVFPQALSNQAWPIGQGIISMSPLTPRWQKEKKVKVGTGALCLPPLLTHTQLTERDISSCKRFTPVKISDGMGVLFISIRTI